MNRSEARATVRRLLSAPHPLEGIGRIGRGGLTELAAAYRVVAETSTSPEYELSEARKYEAFAAAYDA